MKFKLLIFCLLLLASIRGLCQKKIQHDQYNPVLEEKIKNLDQENKNLEKNIERLEKSISELSSAVKTDIKSNKDDVKELINTYGVIISVVVGIIIFFINLIGKSSIKKRIEEIISETAQSHIEKKIVEISNSKVTNELIAEIIRTKGEEEIQKIIAELQQEGQSVIDGIKNKGEEVIKSMIALPPTLEISQQEGDLSDEQINDNNNAILANDFFNLAYKSQHPKIQIELYNNVLEIEPKNIHALNNLSVAYNNLNQPEKAVEALNKLISINENFYLAYSNRAQSYNLMGDYEKALKDIEKVNAMAPQHEFAYAVKGNILTKKGNFEDAEKSLNKAVEINQNSAEAHFNLAFFYEERGKYKESLENYELAEKLGLANKAMLYNNMAVLCRRLVRLDKAVEYIEKARQFNPDFPNIDGTLALIYADRKDDQNFFHHLTIALEKGCKVWDYLDDPAFKRYGNSKKLNMLIEPYKTKYLS